MGLLSALVRGGSPLAVAGDVNDERMWSSGGPTYLTDTGLRLSPDLAFSVSCVFQGTRLIAEPMGRFKPVLYQRLGEHGDEGKERAWQHPLWRVLMLAANDATSAARFRVVMTARAVLWGNSYAEIRPTADAAVGKLIMLDSDRVRPEQVTEDRWRYVVTNDRGSTRTLVQDQVFHLPGFGLDRFMGAELLYYARQAVALWLAQEKFNALYFKQGAKPSIGLEHPSHLSEAAQERIRASAESQVAGVDKMHRVFISEEGMKIKEFGFNARDSQMTEAHESQVHEIARWMNVPVHLLRATQQPTFASIEMFNREYYDITLSPWFSTWEQEIGRQLIGDTDQFFAEFLLDALLAANTVDKATAYGSLIDHGVMSENEVRAQGYNLNKRPGLDEPQRSVNQGRAWPVKERVDAVGALVRAGFDPAAATAAMGLPPMEHIGLPPVTVQPEDRATNPPPSPNPPRPPMRERPPEEDEGQEASARRLRLFAQDAAECVVRREIAAVKALAKRTASDASAWAAGLDTFYAEHAQHVAEKMNLPPRAAREYAEVHRAGMLAGGLRSLEDNETAAVAALVRLALGEA